MRRTNDPSRALRLLLHPLWLGALALLVLNDHLLKGAGLLPTAVTGKLSDFAGLLVAPLLLAALLGARGRRAFAAIHGAVGLVFAGINLWPAFARGFEAATGLTPLPWSITVDPTDLVALPALAVSWMVFAPPLMGRRPTRAPRPRRLLRGSALAAGVLACMATSPPDDPRPEDRFPHYLTDLVIANDTEDTLVLRIRALHDDVYVDCERAAQDPIHALSRKLFAPAQLFLVDPGRSVPVRGDRWAGTLTEAACHAYLVDGGGLPMRLFFWMDGEYQLASLPSTVAGAVEDSAIFVRPAGLEPTDGIRFSEHPVVGNAPPLEDQPAAPACRGPEPGEGVAWPDLVPLGDHQLVAVESSPDGCHALDLAAGGLERRWFLCTTPEAMPFSAGETLTIGLLGHGQRFEDIVGVQLIGDHAILRAGRGADLVRFGLGDVSVSEVPACSAGSHDECGSLIVPLAVTVEPEGEAAIALEPGDAVPIGENGTLYLLRAEAVPIGVSSCLQSPADGTVFIDSVYVEEDQP